MDLLVIYSGAQAHALAEFLMDNCATDVDATIGGEVVLSQQGSAIYVSAQLASATIAHDGEVDES